MPPSPSPSPSETPPDDGWLTIHGPLIVLPDGGWQVLISLLALAVSAATLWYTLSGRAVIDAQAVKIGRRERGSIVFDGYDVIVYNTGRIAAILTSIDLETGEDEFSTPRTAHRGIGRETVEFPAMPLALNPQTAVRTSFPDRMGDSSGEPYTYRFRIQYLRPARFGRSGRVDTIWLDPPADA